MRLLEMTLPEDVELEVERRKRELEARGIRVVDDSGQRVNGTASVIVPAQPIARKQAPSRKSVGMSPDKFKAFYNYLMDSGMYIAPSMELDFGAKREIPLDDAGTVSLTLAEESYNANLTFTMLTCLLQNTSMVYFGPPGAGKTTTAEFVISGVYGIPLSVIQKATIYGHPELTEEKMLAFVDVVSFLKKYEKVIGVRDFMKTPARIIDEVNRIPPGKLSILYQVLDRGWAVYNNQKIVAKPGPLFATANGADSGNFEVPPAFMDRFDIGLVVDHLNPFFIRQFIEKRSNKIRYVEDKVVTPPSKISYRDIVAARKEIHYGVSMPSDLVNKLAHFLAELNSCDRAGVSVEKKTKGNALYKVPGPLCQDCSHYSNDKNICSATENGLSARTISTVYAYSKAMSWWRGNSSVSEEDAKYVLAFSSWFKLRPTRKIIEKEECFTNDRTAMVQTLWETASQSYEEIATVFPGYKQLTQTVADYYISGKKPDKSSLEDMMSNLSKVDSPAKFSLAVALKKMYQDYDRS